MTRLILASGSAARQKMLRDANIPCDAIPASIDEPALKKSLLDEGRSAQDIALALAAAKARSVAEIDREALVIGCDQVLEHRGTLFSKPKTRDDAQAQLRSLSGSDHRLISAISIVQNETELWQHASDVRLFMRSLSESYITDYLDRNWPAVGSVVGSYHLEGEGARLFEAVDGDYFTVLGLPLIPLVSWLTERGVLKT